jgi:hypothetical protein
MIFPESRFARAARSIEVSKGDPSVPFPIPTSGQEDTLRSFPCHKLALISGRRALFPETYWRIFFRSSGRRILDPTELLGTQEFALKEELPPLLSISPCEPTSPLEPSGAQLASGFAATTQFPPGIRGEAHFGGIFPTITAGPPKHIAIPTAPVIVGVMKRRKKLDELSVPSHPPAPRPLQVEFKGEIGQTAGTHPPGVGSPVIAENTGIPESTVRGASGIPIIAGAEPGASGA